MEDELQKKIITGIISGLVGVGVGLMAGIVIGKKSIALYDNARTFSYNGSQIIRTYEKQRKDNIFVQDPNDPNNHFSLQKHLRSISNKYDKKIEESEIKKLVDW
jgi:hypothetical protein